MAASNLICVIFMMLLVSLSPAAVQSSGGGGGVEGWLPLRSSSEGLISDVMAADGEEFAMDSEISRRVLQSSGRYISYGALQRNTVPCSRRGASYYNCRAGAQANPYSRGCSAITRCRS
ncbi:unnamed protein product [Linum tenue]|uniref:Rapid alkalinization factor-like n=3 Tax=Linum tenue TaxID=586396 RepID=A0AAV0R4J5_9ROSI|nr:unnamed protein product [Linum tenue]CAI0551362.1 unnamed protein product [Linum tenue]